MTELELVWELGLEMILLHQKELGLGWVVGWEWEVWELVSELGLGLVEVLVLVLEPVVVAEEVLVW
jgi:hypothetical protein